MIAGKKLDARTWEVQSVVEKPDPKETPSILASVGRFVMAPYIFHHIPKLKKRGGEIYFSDALDILSKEKRLYGYELDATWYDCGSKIGFYRATVELGMRHKEIGPEAKKYLKKLAL